MYVYTSIMYCTVHLKFISFVVNLQLGMYMLNFIGLDDNMRAMHALANNLTVVARKEKIPVPCVEYWISTYDVRMLVYEVFSCMHVYTNILYLGRFLQVWHRLIIALFDWGRKWPPLEMVIYTSNFTAQTTMYVDFYNCLVF